MSRTVPNGARELAVHLELLCGHDGELARQLNDTQQRLQRAYDRLWSALHPDAVAAVYGEHLAAVEATLANRRSEILDPPDPLREAHRAHWSIHAAFGAYQAIPERRRQLAAGVGELAADLIAILVAAGWPQQEARTSDMRKLARTGRDAPKVRDQYHGLSEAPERSDRAR